MPSNQTGKKIRINSSQLKANKIIKPCVYRYVDLRDNIIKYVGIVTKSPLERRILDHAHNDEWCKNGIWRVEYFECETQSEAEAFESHLIELYGTWRYDNKSKSHWGINRYLPNVAHWWQVFSESHFSDIETMKFVAFIREKIRCGDIDLACKLMEFIEVVE